MTRTLVLGGTGTTGGRVVDRLAALGLPVRIGSRTAEPPFDWRREATWMPALRGVDAVYLAFQPHLAAPGAANAVRAFAGAAAMAGVRRLVLLSCRGEAGALAAEQAVRQSSVPWTIVRAAWFDQDFSEGYLYDSVLAGEVALPVRPVGEPFVDAGDIADVAVAALTDERHAGRLYEVTGPRLLTFAEAVEELSEATGRRIRYERITVDEWTAQLSVPDDVAWLLAHLYTDVLDGRNARIGDGVQRALGREPRDFAEFAQAAAATGVWSIGRVG
ncbi:MAG TPA: NAD(P)H-binding protein [Solirubrobacteraceae bacterium]|jgi:uncharacterized protein YbjT (DUF2867 family)